MEFICFDTLRLLLLFYTIALTFYEPQRVFPNLSGFFIHQFREFHIPIPEKILILIFLYFIHEILIIDEI